MKIDYKKELNKEQLKAVTEGDGYSLILSGPGSGKTRVLTFRVVYLLENGVNPEDILLLTFTKKAAREMLFRIENLTQETSNTILGGTFHHVGNYYLKKYHQIIGYDENYTILDQEDSRSLINYEIKDIDENDLPNAKILQSLISLSINSDKEIEEVAKTNLSRKYNIEKIKEINKKYKKRKIQKNLMDYDDLLFNWLKLLETPKIGDLISSRFKYVLVDEYQDTNAIQDKILERLTAINKNLMVVGDDSQSIYSFRAAEIKNILTFSDKFDARIFKLETNYRSTPEILKIANCIINENKIKLKKELKSIKKNGNNPSVTCLSSPKEQAKFIVKKLNELEVNKSAVLFRAHYQAAGLELELAKAGIPYVVRGGTRFFEQAHIKDLLSFIKILVNFQDETSWSRILKKQKGIGDAFASKFISNISDITINDLLLKKEAILSNFSNKNRSQIEEIINLFLLIKDQEKPEDIIKIITNNWYKQKMEDYFDNSSERLEDLKQFASLAKEYSNFQEMISDFALSEDFEISYSDGNYLTLSTIHQAKGLEWDNVFIISLSDGQFPHKKAIEESLVEEERRLFYVAVTRCKENLFLTYSVFDRGEVMPVSRFLNEIEDYISKDLLNEDGFDDEIELIDEDDENFF